MENKDYKLKVIIICIFLFVAVMSMVFYTFFANKQNKYEVINKNTKSFVENVNKINENRSKTQITFRDLTDFKWDDVYVFAPYTDDKYCKDILDNDVDIYLGSSATEDETKIVFLYEGNIVCTINNITDNLGFNISYNYEEYGGYKKISYSDDNYIIDVNINNMYSKNCYLYIRTYKNLYDYNNILNKYYGLWESISDNQNIKMTGKSVVLNEYIINKPYVNIEYINYYGIEDKYNISAKDLGLSLSWDKSVLEVNISDDIAINHVVKLIIIDDNVMFLEENNLFIKMQRISYN